MEKNALAILGFFILSLFTVLPQRAEAFTFSCRLEDGKSVGQDSGMIGLQVTGGSDRKSYRYEVVCRSKKKKTRIVLKNLTTVELGLFADNNSGTAVLLSCPFVSIKQLKKSSDRKLTFVGADTGVAMASLGIWAGVDSRGNYCHLLKVGTGLGVTAGVYHFELKVDEE